MQPVTKLHFARFEFKYVLPLRVREAVESELQYFMELDPYVVSRPNKQYFVRSLYFDDPAYSCFYDKIDGLHTRAKFRIRTYTNSSQDGSPQFLEVKSRYNNLVFKHRLILREVKNGAQPKGVDLVATVLERCDDGTVRKQFEYELYRKRLQPMAVMDYYRRPYVSKYDPEFRLTFDDQLHGTAATSLHPFPGDRCRRILAGYTIVEIKFRHRVPGWFHSIIRSYELRRVSISKICQGVEALGLAENLS